jgi:hypothetical protein
MKLVSGVSVEHAVLIQRNNAGRRRQRVLVWRLLLANWLPVSSFAELIVAR